VESVAEVDTELPDEPARARLLAGLARVNAKCGWERLVSTPLLLPEPRFFPDRWEPNVRGARRLLARLMIYAGLDHLDLVVTPFTEATWQEFDASGFGHAGPGAAAWFGGTDHGVCRFGVNVNELRNEDELVGTLCHEVAHAFRHEHGLQVIDADVEEELTDLTAVYLGFGVMVLESSFVFKTGGYTPHGQRLSWERRSRGYLSPATLALLLAAQFVARGQTLGQRKAIGRALSPNHRKLFEDACALFEQDPGELRAIVGVPSPDQHPEPKPLDHYTRALSEEDDLDEADGAASAPTGEPAWRTASDRAAVLGMLGAGAPLMAAGVGLLDGWWLLGSMLGGAALGSVIGRTWKSWRCSECGSAVAEADLCCARCGRALRDRATLHEHEDDAGEQPYDYYSDPLVSDLEKSESKLLTALFVAWLIRRGMVDDGGSDALEELSRAVSSGEASAEALFAAWPWIQATLDAEVAAFADSYFDRAQGSWPEDYSLLTTLVAVRDTPATYQRFAARFDARFEAWRVGGSSTGSPDR
jgi:hypothetical protein